MKKVITTSIFVTLLGFCSTSFGQSYYYYNSASSGSGHNKGDAVASALMQVPYGAKIQKVDISGHSIKQYVSGLGYIQTEGSYKCKIHYRK